MLSEIYLEVDLIKEKTIIDHSQYLDKYTTGSGVNMSFKFIVYSLNFHAHSRFVLFIMFSIQKIYKYDHG